MLPARSCRWREPDIDEASRCWAIPTPSQAAVIRKQQQSLGVEVKTPDSDEPGQFRWEAIKDCRTALRVLFRCQKAPRLVKQPKARPLTECERLSIHSNRCAFDHIESRASQYASIDRHASLRDQSLGVASRAHSAREIAFAMRSPAKPERFRRDGSFGGSLRASRLGSGAAFLIRRVLLLPTAPWSVFRIRGVFGRNREDLSLSSFMRSNTRSRN